mgnify:FL=1
MSDNNGAAEMTNETKAVSTKRLREIAHAIADGNANELTMRVPAEPGRDADLVVMSAADELDRLREDRDAFRASSEIRGAEVERMRARVALLEPVASAARIEIEHLRARVALLEPVASAARIYYRHYMQDEADDGGEQWCGHDQHERAKAVRDSLHDLEPFTVKELRL